MKSYSSEQWDKSHYYKYLSFIAFMASIFMNCETG